MIVTECFSFVFDAQFCLGAVCFAPCLHAWLISFWIDSGEAKYIFKWLLFQLLPILISVRYMSEHFLRKWWADRSRVEVSYSWNEGFKASLFLGNTLYIGVTSSVVSTFMCEKLGDSDSYYLIAAPTIKCYQGTHIATLVLSIIPLVVYVIGWPCCLFGILYFGQRRNMLQQAEYGAVFGFLFKRCNSLTVFRLVL